MFESTLLGASQLQLACNRQRRVRTCAAAVAHVLAGMALSTQWCELASAGAILCQLSLADSSDNACLLGFSYVQQALDVGCTWLTAGVLQC